jgi:hypothetical protein
MVIICPTLCISGCAQGSSELSYRQVAARDYRVPEVIDRHSVSYSVNDAKYSLQYLLQYSMALVYTTLLYYIIVQVYYN